MSRISTIVLSISFIAACKTPEGQEWKPTVGVAAAVVDSYSADISALGFSGSGDVDYSLVQFELGATKVTPNETRPLKHEFAGIVFGVGDLSAGGASADLVEISGGGRYYFDKGGTVIPFLSIWSTISTLDDPLVDTPQLGLRFGGGIEYPFAGNLAATLSGDYTLPLIDAEDSTGLVSSSVDGVAIRLGLRLVM